MRFNLMVMKSRLMFLIHNIKVTLFKKKRIKEVLVKPSFDDIDLVNKFGSYYMAASDFYTRIDGFKKQEKAIMFSVLFFNELSCGTFIGMIYHTGDQIKEIIESLKEIKLNDYVTKVESIMKMFPNNEYDEEKLSAEIEDYCNTLEYDENSIEDAIKNYILENKEYLV
jgi:hypothetical protein